MPHLRSHPRLRQPKAPDEHSIFVKNVPKWWDKSTILELYEEYGALGMRKIHPNSSITTVVVSFPTNKDAVRAQMETDGMRLDNVILSVELQHNKQRSVRFARENRFRRDSLEDIDEDYEGDAEKEVANDDTPEHTSFGGFVPPAPMDDAAKDTTWARIAANTKPAPTTVDHNKAPKVVLSAKIPMDTTTDTLRPQSPLSPPTDTPQQLEYTGQNFQPNLIADPLTTSKASNISDKTNWDSNSKRDHQPKATTEAGGFSHDVTTWDPIDTTERIRWRHCAECYFCHWRKRC
ncbi:hypothetical protein N0V83_000819 [Neocucurbitaria cava]|uniref:RRM domain-containing protein n=1 Tax=Neocucurbitaria cava TaxID=798079 RepID=A0A9W8YI08_9PLEO|nr:hypothetical protein N0V83_000819 [Neocucurbitaria cava]